jgi:hypothetical protein
VDSRYFGKANISNRLQSFFQMVEARRARKGPALPAAGEGQSPKQGRIA